MSHLPYDLDPDTIIAPPIGLIVLQVDETIEPDFGHYFANQPNPIYVTRIPSGAKVTHETLAGMESNIAAAADLLPKARPYPVVGYGCTSASAVIGSDIVEKIVKQTCDTATVTNPLRATTACAADLGICKYALLSPYIEEVNTPLRAAFAKAGISMDVFGTFGEAEEAKVVRISHDSVVAAGVKLGSDPLVEGLFMSCTNLRTLRAIPEIAARIGKPVLSSNQSLAWHIKALIAANQSGLR